MEFDCLDGLDDLGISTLNVIDNNQRCNLPNEDNFACLRYSGIIKNDDDIKEAIEKGTKSIEFTQLVEWLSKELQALNDMESCVNAITDFEDSSSFLMEVSSFLKELHCPYTSLTTGPISQRLIDVQSRKTLIDYLVTELLAARVLHKKKKKLRNALEINKEDSSIATVISLHAKHAMKVLNIDVNRISLDPVLCFTEIETKAKAILDSNPGVLSLPIITETLSDEQWKSLRLLYEDLFSEYTVRRKLLLTRLEVTIQSFTWGEGSKGKENKIKDVYLSCKKDLKPKPSVKLSDVIAAKEDLLVVEKTSGANLVKNTRSSVNRVLIAAVPDRGGRPREQRPPVEMPNWMKRVQGGGEGGGHWQGRGKKFRGSNQDNRGGGRGGGGQTRNQTAGHYGGGHCEKHKNQRKRRR